MWRLCHFFRILNINFREISFITIFFVIAVTYHFFITWYKSWTINKLYFLRCVSCSFFPIFIKCCNFFGFCNWKVFLFFIIFSQTIKFAFKLFCLLFYNKMLSLVRSISKNQRNIFKYTIFQIIYAVCKTSLYSPV